MGAVESGGVITLTGVNTLASIESDIADSAKFAVSGSVYTTGTTITEIQHDTGSAFTASDGETLEVANTVAGFVFDMNGTATFTMNGASKITVPVADQGTNGWHFNLADTANVDINDTAIIEYMGFGAGNSSAFICNFGYSGTVDLANGTTMQNVQTNGNSAFISSSGNSSPYTINLECNFDNIDVSNSGNSFKVFFGPAGSNVVAGTTVTFKDCVMTNMTGFLALQLGRTQITGDKLILRFINITGLPAVAPATTVQNTIEFYNTAYTSGPDELAVNSIVRDFIYLTLTVDDGTNPVTSGDVQIKSEDGLTTYYQTSGYGGSDVQTDGSGQVVLNKITTTPQDWEHIDGSTART